MKRNLHFGEALQFAGADTAIQCNGCGRTIDIFNKKGWEKQLQEGMYAGDEHYCWRCTELGRSEE
jgi:hypothetical protein